MSSFTVWRGDIPVDRFMIVTNDFMRGKLPVPLHSLARVLLGYLLSLPAEWEMDRPQLDSSVTEGRDAVNTALNELETAGYLQRVRLHADRGAWAWAWRVTDDPVARPLSPSPGNPGMESTSENGASPQVAPSTGNPSTGNQGISKKTDSKKTDLEEGDADATPVQLSLVPAALEDDEQFSLVSKAMRVYLSNWDKDQFGPAVNADATERWVRETADRFDCDEQALLNACLMAAERGKVNPAPAYRPAPLSGPRLTKAAQAIARAVYDAHSGEVNFGALMQRAKTALRAGRDPQDIRAGIEALITDSKPVTQQLLAQYAEQAKADRLNREAAGGRVQRG